MCGSRVSESHSQLQLHALSANPCSYVLLELVGCILKGKHVLLALVGCFLKVKHVLLAPVGKMK